MKRKLVLMICLCLLVLAVSVYYAASDNATRPLFYLSKKTVTSITMQKYSGGEIYELSIREKEIMCAAYSQLRLKRDHTRIDKGKLMLDFHDPLVVTFETVFGKVKIYAASITNDYFNSNLNPSYVFVNGHPYIHHMDYGYINGGCLPDISRVMQNHLEPYGEIKAVFD